MTNCKHCGGPNPEGSRICQYCGSSLPVPPREPAPQPAKIVNHYYYHRTQPQPQEASISSQLWPMLKSCCSGCAQILGWLLCFPLMVTAVAACQKKR